MFSPGERRLRAAWRLAGQLAILLASLLVLSVIWGIGQAVLENELSYSLVETQLIAAIAITASVWFARGVFDRRSFSSLGLQVDRQTGRDLVVGFLIAALMLTLVYTLERIPGWLTTQSTNQFKAPVLETLLALVGMLGFFLVTGWQEELYFRGYLMNNLEEGLSRFLGVLLSALVFGFVHLTNPHATFQSVVGISLFGLLMAFACLRSGRLWLAIGLHSAWNFIEGPLLGYPVSGLNMVRVIQTQVDGPTLITGGLFGPEAGLVVIPALTLGAVLIWFYTRPRHPIDNAALTQA